MLPTSIVAHSISARFLSLGIVAGTLGCVLPSITFGGTLVAGDLAPRGAPDSQLNVADVLILQRAVMNLIAPTIDESLAGDVAPLGNPDGVLNAADVAVLMRAVR